MRAPLTMPLDAWGSACIGFKVGTYIKSPGTAPALVNVRDTVLDLEGLATEARRHM